MNKGTWIALLAAVLLLTLGAAWYWFSDRPAQDLGLPTVDQAAQDLPTATEPEPAEYPVPEATQDDAQAPAAPLPALDDSDAQMREALEQAFGAPPVEGFLVPERLIRHIVVTIDSLDRAPVRLKQRPVAHVAGPISVDRVDDRLYLSGSNADRYDAYVSALDAADTGLLVAAYLRYYPLFQRAYEELGYPQRYFNDRLIAVLDHLLATPDVARPIELLRPKVLYTFADERLEAMSWGRKVLVRIGAEHAATVQRKLADIRAQIVEQTGSD